LQIHVHHLQTPSTDQQKWKNIPPLPNAAWAFKTITLPSFFLGHLPRQVTGESSNHNWEAGSNNFKRSRPCHKKCLSATQSWPEIFRAKISDQWKQNMPGDSSPDLFGMVKT